MTTALSSIENHRTNELTTLTTVLSMIRMFAKTLTVLSAMETCAFCSTFMPVPRPTPLLIVEFVTVTMVLSVTVVSFAFNVELINVN